MANRKPKVVNSEEAPEGYTAAPCDSDISCNGCTFLNRILCPENKCRARYRKDGCNVIFIKRPGLANELDTFVERLQSAVLDFDTDVLRNEPKAVCDDVNNMLEFIKSCVRVIKLGVNTLYQ